MARVTFLLTILGILLLIFLSQTTTPIQSGTIESIQSNGNVVRIKLTNNPAELILFDTSFINLKKGDFIKFQGRADEYKNKKQIIVDKIFEN